MLPRCSLAAGIPLDWQHFLWAAHVHYALRVSNGLRRALDKGTSFNLVRHVLPPPHLSGRGAEAAASGCSLAPLPAGWALEKLFAGCHGGHVPAQAGRATQARDGALMPPPHCSGFQMAHCPPEAHLDLTSTLSTRPLSLKA